jgi:hypothetical protein
MFGRVQETGRLYGPIFGSRVWGLWECERLLWGMGGLLGSWPSNLFILLYDPNVL